VERDGEEEECASGRRSRPINLATKVGVLVPGEALISEERSLKLSVLDLVPLPLVLIRMFFCVSRNIQNHHYYHQYSLYRINKPK